MRDKEEKIESYEQELHALHKHKLNTIENIFKKTLCEEFVGHNRYSLVVYLRWFCGEVTFESDILIVFNFSFLFQDSKSYGAINSRDSVNGLPGVKGSPLSSLNSTCTQNSNTSECSSVLKIRKVNYMCHFQVIRLLKNLVCT